MRQLLSLLFVLLASYPAYAVRVPSIYQATVPVNTQSADDKARAAGQGLSKVLVKVTGNPDIIDNPSLKFQLNNAQRFVREANYAPGTQTPFVLKFKFDEDSVNQVVHDADVQIWGLDRPLILSWVVFQVPGKQPEIIDSSSLSDIKSSLQAHAEQRGIPVIFPVMDMNDLNQVSANDIITMNKANLEKVSKRYDSEAMLIAKIYPQPTGFIVEAKLLSGNNEWNWKLSDNTADDVLNKLVDNVADTMASHAPSFSAASAQEQVMLKVTGVNQHSDYELLIKYLKDLTPVANVELVRMSGSTVLLMVSIRGTQRSLVQALNVGSKLIPVQSNDISLKDLIYQWKR